MNKILLIDTSEAKCSVAMAQNGVVIAEISSGDEAQMATAKSDHSEKLARYIEEIVAKNGAFDAVAVNIGPGSYTGLRIGLSTAKGLCYGASKPLIAIDSLTALTQAAIGQNREIAGGDILVPMIDARRMEVYSAKYSAEGEKIAEVQPIILDENSLSDLGATHYIFGSGAKKCYDLLHTTRENLKLIEVNLSAGVMANVAQKMYENEEFQDVAYLEPFYLKEWQPAVPQKKQQK